MEETDTAKFYNNKSVAEQNSIDIAWALLEDSQFDLLRSTICKTTEEFKRFRQLVVNIVLATDICDKELKALRNARWEKAFSEKATASLRGSLLDEINRKATIVLEHLIQASDVAHTMQHWHVFKKWNERLYAECHKAWCEGRAEKDPSEFWFEGEIGFFDFYVIPLAKKLKDCGVFGVSSDEYLNYAVSYIESFGVLWSPFFEFVVFDACSSMMLMCFLVSKDKQSQRMGKKGAPNCPRIQGKI